MHRQLINSGGIRKLLPGNNNNSHERWSKPSQLQQESQLTKALPPTTNTSATVRTQPSQNDVICARGRTYWDHPGNQLYRNLISLAKEQYSKAPNRLGKSLIVSEIIRHIHKANGRFMKKIRRKGGNLWVECSLNFVREKVTQSLRDGLSFKYSSSTMRKRQRKAQAQEIFDSDIDRIVHSNAAVSKKINDLKYKVEWINRHRGTESEGISDETMMEIFQKANLDILETMKKDQSMLDQLHRATNNKAGDGPNDKRTSSRFLSPPTQGSKARHRLLSHSKSAPPTLLSQSYKTLFDTNKTQQINSSVLPPNSTTVGMNQQFKNKNNDDSSCDDMDLDLESPSMFLDEVGRYALF